MEELENIILGMTIVQGSVILVYTVAVGLMMYSVNRLQKSVQRVKESTARVKESTTRLLDVTTTYLAPRVTQEEISAFSELAKTREKYNI